MNLTLLVTIFSIVTAVAAAIAVVLELRRDLMMLQQNSYRYDRYMRWLRSSGDSTSLIRLAAMAAFLISLSRFIKPQFGLCMVLLVALCVILKALTVKYKKPLVMTARATRIFVCSLAIVAAIAIVATAWFASTDSLDSIATVASIALIGCYCASHIVIVVANAILQPLQNAINRRYYNDARRKLADMPDLTVIGITGSYGKTSTKHYLYEILSEHFDVLMTPGNFNTTLGVVRTVREMLKPYITVFIVEMGAKQKGDIEEICKLVNPQIGIITAVGPQHLETFHTIQRVRDTKFELVDALPADGLAVLNDDFEMIATRMVNNVPDERYSVEPESSARFIARDITYSPHGTTFTIVDRLEGDKLTLTTNLVGACNISNLMAAVIVARHLGIPDDKIRIAVSRIAQVEHRLQIKHTGLGYTLIDDAYNSNPVGSSMALDVLASFTGGRRFIITPGMIELGDDQEHLNHEFGKKIPAAADVAFIVGQYNRNAIISGINEVDPDHTRCKVIEAPSFIDAHRQFLEMVKPGDTVLYENDLPDTFK